MAKINGGSAPIEGTRVSAPVVTRPDLGIASDDREAAFLKSTAPLPKSLYGGFDSLALSNGQAR